MSQQDDLFPPELNDSDSDWATGLDDDFDDLRTASSMSTDVYGDMEMVADRSTGDGGGGMLSRFSALQKLILAVLILVLVVVYGAAALLAVGLVG